MSSRESVILMDARRLHKQLHRYLGWLLCVLLMLLPLAATATGARPHPLRVGYTNASGFITMNPNGNIDGYGVAYLNEIARYTGWRYEYVPGTWQQCLDRLERGEIDLLGMAQYTEARADKYDFAALPSGVEYMVMYVRNDDNAVYYNDYQSFNGLRIGVLKGNFQTDILHTVAKNNAFNYTQIVFDSSQEMVTALENRQVDAIVTGSMPLHKNLRLVGRFQADPIYFMTTKGNDLILQKLDDALMNIHANSPNFETDTYRNYYAQSQLTTQPLFTKSEKDFLARRDAITIGFLPDDRPLSWLDPETGLMKGILPEIVKKLEQLCGTTILLRQLPPGADFVAAMQSGKYDLIAGMIASEPYTNNLTLRLSKPFFKGRVMSVSRKNAFINLNQPQRVALPAHFLAYKSYIQNNYPDFTIITKADMQDCMQAVADGEADLTLQNSNVISYQLQNPRFENLQILSLFNFSDNLCLAAPNTTEGSELLTIFNKSIDILDTKSINDIVMDQTAATPYKLTFSDLLYKYNRVISALFLLIIIASIVWFYFDRQRQAYLQLLERTNKELAEAAQQAQAASKAKSSFLSRMSHEIRTPLNAILGFAHFARQAGDHQKCNGYLEKITYSSELLLGIVNDVLDMSAIESQKLKLDHSPFELRKILQQLHSIYESQCRDKNITLQFDCATAGHQHLVGDSLRLQQIISNLLANAVKFTDPGGRIDFTVEQQPTADPAKTLLRLVVTDTGCGMSEQMLSQVFQPFEQEDGSTARKYGGSGLGLSIVKNLVEMMHGQIIVSSTKNSGSTFMVELPLTIGAEITAATVSIAAAQEKLQGLHVLLAEDNLINQELCLELLHSCGMTCDCAANGQEALNMFTDSKPGFYALILMDIQMPVLDGYAATLRIRASAHPEAQTIPIVAVSADAFMEDIKRAQASGMNAHVTKPIVPDEFFRAMLLVLQQRQEAAQRSNDGTN